MNVGVVTVVSVVLTVWSVSRLELEVLVAVHWEVEGMVEVVAMKGKVTPSSCSIAFAHTLLLVRT